MDITEQRARDVLKISMTVTEEQGSNLYVVFLSRDMWARARMFLGDAGIAEQRDEASSFDAQSGTYWLPIKHGRQAEYVALLPQGDLPPEDVPVRDLLSEGREDEIGEEVLKDTFRRRLGRKDVPFWVDVPVVDQEVKDSVGAFLQGVQNLSTQSHGYRPF